MTEEQHKKLAEVTLLNASIVGGLATGYAMLVEKILPLIADKDEELLALLSHLEQLQAITHNLQPSLDAAREELGLDN